MAEKSVTAATPASSVPLPRAKRGLKSFFGDLRRELTKVSWPTIAETNRLTIVVLAVCLLLVFLLGTMGIIFDQAIKALQGTS